MTKVAIYNAAIAVAQDQLTTPGNVAFEARMADKAVSLGLTDAEFTQFSQQSKQVRSTLLQLQAQDNQIAAQAAVAAKNAAAKASPVTGTTPAQ